MTPRKRTPTDAPEPGAAPRGEGATPGRRTRTKARPAAKPGDGRAVQAWVELVAPDPEATSALAVARRHLPGGETIETLRRLRLFELVGALPDGPAVGELLHRSIQFYNPRKERCTVRGSGGDPAPLGVGEGVVLIVDRGATRRRAAERWWLHETGSTVEVREGVAWAVRFRGGAPPEASRLEELAVLRDRRHGLLCNPHAQDHRIAAGGVPLPWIGDAGDREGGG